MTSMRTFAAACLTCMTLVVVAGCHRHAETDEHMEHMNGADLAAPAGSFAASQSNVALPPSNNAAKARLGSSPRHGEWVKFACEPGSSDSLMAWIVYPSTSSAQTPVVVVVHEIFGLSTWVRSVADQVAADGFIAIAPDLESRVRGGPSTEELSSDSARKLIAGVSAAERNRGIAAVAKYALSQASAAPRSAVSGYYSGGDKGWLAADGRVPEEEPRRQIGLTPRMGSESRKPSPNTATNQLAAFIGKFDAANAKLIRSSRAALRRRLPTANELVYDNYNFLAIGFCSSERASDCIVSLAAGS